MLTKLNVLVCLVLSLHLLQTGCKGFNQLNGVDQVPATKKSAERVADSNTTIRHLGHSAVMVQIGERVLVFDYPFGSRAFADQIHFFDPNELNELKNKKVYVFASHGHGDHFNRGIFSWKKQIGHVRYILSSDIKRHPADANMISPGQVIEVDDIKVRGYRSSDMGVAFSIYVAGRHIYFAGDNGFWNWKGKRPEGEYISKDLALVDRKVPMDIAFQVCDPLADDVGDGGIGIFALSFKPKLLAPIHLRGKYEFLKKIELQLKQRGFKNRFWVVKKKGDSMSF
jgi:L-ascorbate metabolism protein UlaG (beta-lactamase superfamily)